MTGPLFVDANVFLYASDDSEPVKQARAIAWWDSMVVAAECRALTHRRARRRGRSMAP
jgi:predicted nucleic acid-binding protein